MFTINKKIYKKFTRNERKQNKKLEENEGTKINYKKQ